MSNGSEHIPERPPFVPQIWAEDALRTLRNGLVYGWVDENPTHIYVDEPLDPDFLAAREAFRERWDAMIAEGEAAGFLDRDTCYECPGEMFVPNATTHYVRQPNPDYDPTKPRDSEPAVVPVVERDAIHLPILGGNARGCHDAAAELPKRLTDRAERAKDQRDALQERIDAAVFQLTGDQWLYPRELTLDTLRGRSH